MNSATSRRTVRPAARTADIRYAVRDVVLLADEAARAGREMLYLNVGDPNLFGFAPPAHLIDATVAAMRANLNGYAPSSGIPDALGAIRAEAARKGIGSIVHAYVTSGASEAIELALAALADPGENVLTPAPGYPLYTAVLAKLGVENRGYLLDEGNGWQPDPEDIRRRIDARTRAIVLINPNNPTGSLTEPDVLDEIVAIALEHDLVIFSDEIYDKLVLDEGTHISTAARSAEAKIVTFNGLSKSYLVPGFRIGWGIVSGPAAELEPWCEAIRKMERARLSANHPEQHAIRAALEGPQDHLVAVRARLAAQGRLTTERLNAIPGITCVEPRGAFYAFPRIELGIDDDAFCRKVIRETGVVIVPGSGFGQAPATSHFRVVFLPDAETLGKAFDRIEQIALECRRG